MIKFIGQTFLHLQHRYKFELSFTDIAYLFRGVVTGDDAQHHAEIIPA